MRRRYCRNVDLDEAQADLAGTLRDSGVLP